MVVTIGITYIAMQHGCVVVYTIYEEIAFQIYIPINVIFLPTLVINTRPTPWRYVPKLYNWDGDYNHLWVYRNVYLI